MKNGQSASVSWWECMLHYGYWKGKKQTEEGRTGWQTCWNGVLPVEVGVLYAQHERYMVCMVGRDAANYLHLSAPIWTDQNSNKKIACLPWNKGAASVHREVRRQPNREVQLLCQPASTICWERSSRSFPTWLYSSTLTGQKGRPK